MEIFESIKKRTSWNWCLKFFVQLVGTKFFYDVDFRFNQHKASTSEHILQPQHRTRHFFSCLHHFSLLQVFSTHRKKNFSVSLAQPPTWWCCVFSKHFSSRSWLLTVCVSAAVVAFGGFCLVREREEGGEDEDEKDDDSSEGWVSRYKERICFRAQKVTAKWTTSTWNSFNFLLTLTF